MDAKFQLWAAFRRTAVQIVFAAWAAVALSVAVLGQDACISDDRFVELRNAIEQAPVEVQNTALRNEILRLRAVSDQAAQPSNPTPEGSAVFRRLCEVLASNPWPTVSSVGTDAASAWIGLVKNHFPFDLQRRSVALISTGVAKNEIRTDIELASFIDRLRLRSGMPQLFGTQVTRDDGFIVISPLLSVERLNNWRSEYGLNSIQQYIDLMQRSLRTPVIYSTAKPAEISTRAGSASEEQRAADNLLLKADEEDPVRVDTAAVVVNATVFGPADIRVSAEDFKIYEDGQEQTVTSFAASEAPFDIVLLLDLSGSTANKVGLIKRTTRRFIQMKRDGDRIAIVTFTSEQSVVSPLESDRKKLEDRVSKIKGYGASHVWDAMRFSFELLRTTSTSDRRKAVVLMSDGAENALTYLPRFGSKTLLADLVEEIRNGDFAVFPIYLDTESRNADDAKLYEDARRTLRLFATESGGSFYTADGLGDLNRVYERVMQDVGRVYSLGYEPANSRRDGRWRSIRVELPGKPELKVRARRGYYAR